MVIWARFLLETKKEYNIHALSDNIRFYIFGKRETHLEEINEVMDYVNKNYK
jgi:hypothetical protein